MSYPVYSPVHRFYDSAPRKFLPGFVSRKSPFYPFGTLLSIFQLFFLTKHVALPQLSLLARTVLPPPSSTCFFRSPFPNTNVYISFPSSVVSCFISRSFLLLTVLGVHQRSGFVFLSIPAFLSVFFFPEKAGSFDGIFCTLPRGPLFLISFVPSSFAAASPLCPFGMENWFFFLYTWAVSRTFVDRVLFCLVFILTPQELGFEPVTSLL